MRVTVDTGNKQDMTSSQIAILDQKLRSRLPKLLGWSYSPLTGELVLDFGDSVDESQIADIEAKAEGLRKRVEFLGAIKEW